MPLDTGAFADVTLARLDEPMARRPRLALNPNLDVGAGLKAVREGLGLTLEQISEVTRVRARHLAAIEALTLDLLPSRPFTVGYVRAYAKAIGLDADATAARFRTEYPSPDDDELRSPVGVRHEKKSSNKGLIVAAVVVAVVAVGGWNVAQHVMAKPALKG